LILANNLGWIGVDLGTHAVKLAQAVRSSDGVRLRHAAVIQRPSPWSERDALAQDEPDPSWPEILAALECGDFRGRNAACLLPMNVCELRGLKVPQGNEHERRAMIASELTDDTTEHAAPIEFDYWELGIEKGLEMSDGFNVNVMSVTRPWIDRVAADFQRVRLDCWAVDGTPLAMARAVGLATATRNGDRAIAVDWGFSNTTLTVVGKGRPVYARRLHNCHFRKCLEAIQDSLGVTLDHAQHLVDVHGVGAPGAGPSPAVAGQRDIQAAITDAIGDVMASLIEQIGRTLRFVESQRRHQRAAAMWLMGGGASMRNIGPYLSAALGLPVSIWSVPTDRALDEAIQGRQSALFGAAFALSALAWRAA
jgi:Tfp pilus assembly PilM family ATPase